LKTLCLPAQRYRAFLLCSLGICLTFGCAGGKLATSTGDPSTASNPPSTAPTPPSPPAPTPTPTTKSPKRGVAYDLASSADMAALSPGVSWWYNWSPNPNSSVPANYASQYAMDFYPMLWNGNFNATNVVAFLKANPGIQYMLVLNEPNLVSQSNMTPQQGAKLWPQY
jgi:Glycosyl hydrolase catalytic core